MGDILRGPMAPFPPRPSHTPRRRPPALIAFLGWLVPGLGQLFLGRPLKATLFFVAILATFLVGYKLTGFTAVDPRHFRLDFAGQILLGLPTLGALAVGAGPGLESVPPFFEVGRLYVLVAGLLNLVAVCDAVGEAIAQDREVLALRLDRMAQEAAMRETAMREAGMQDAGARGAIDESPRETGPTTAEPALPGWEDPA